MVLLPTLSKKIKNEFMIYLINKTIILPRSFIFKIVFKNLNAFIF